MFVHNWEENLKYVLRWAIFVHVKEAHSQVKGSETEAVQPLVVREERKYWYQVFLCLYFLWFTTISPETSVCVDGKQASFLSVQLFGCQLCIWLAALLFHSFLLEFTYLFIQIDSVGRAEPTVWIPFFAEE